MWIVKVKYVSGEGVFFFNPLQRLESSKKKKKINIDIE